VGRRLPRLPRQAPADPGSLRTCRLTTRRTIARHPRREVSVYTWGSERSSATQGRWNQPWLSRVFSRESRLTIPHPHSPGTSASKCSPSPAGTGPRVRRSGTRQSQLVLPLPLPVAVVAGVRDLPGPKVLTGTTDSNPITYSSVDATEIARVCHKDKQECIRKHTCENNPR
jgi:hypothetical protein